MNTNEEELKHLEKVLAVFEQDEALQLFIKVQEGAERYESFKFFLKMRDELKEKK